MRSSLFLIIFLAASVCTGQTYEETLKRCQSNFQNTFKPGTHEIDYGKAFGELKACVVGQNFPVFTAVSMNGTRFSGNELKGKVVLINLWFIGCPPCVAEMPLLNELQTEFGDKDFLLLSFSRDDKNSITSFLEKKNVLYPVFDGANELIENKFKMTFGYPTTLILDKNGKVISFSVGGATEEPGLTKTKEELKSTIEKALIQQ